MWMCSGCGWRSRTSHSADVGEGTDSQSWRVKGRVPFISRIRECAIVHVDGLEMGNGLGNVNYNSQEVSERDGGGKNVCNSLNMKVFLLNIVPSIILVLSTSQTTHIISIISRPRLRILTIL